MAEKEFLLGVKAACLRRISQNKEEQLNRNDYSGTCKKCRLLCYTQKQGGRQKNADKNSPIYLLFYYDLKSFSVFSKLFLTFGFFFYLANAAAGRIIKLSPFFGKLR